MHINSWALRIDAFEPWCWRRLLRVPWTARRSSQSILKEISPECSLAGLISFRMDWLDHLAVQGTLKSLLQHHGSKALILQCSGPIMSWQIDGETVTDFILGGSKNHCRCWLQPWNEKMVGPWKKSYDQLSILKSRDITLLTKVCLVKTMVFPVVVYECESWTIKKAEH